MQSMEEARPIFTIAGIMQLPLQFMPQIQEAIGASQAVFSKNTCINMVSCIKVLF
jgi:hypothetical protein